MNDPNPGTQLANLRWKNTTKEERQAHIAIMNKARLLKLKQKKNVKTNTSNKR